MDSSNIFQFAANISRSVLAQLRQENQKKIDEFLQSDQFLDRNDVLAVVDHLRKTNILDLDISESSEQLKKYLNFCISQFLLQNSRFAESIRYLEQTKDYLNKSSLKICYLESCAKVNPGVINELMPLADDLLKDKTLSVRGVQGAMIIKLKAVEADFARFKDLTAFILREATSSSNDILSILNSRVPSLISVFGSDVNAPQSMLSFINQDLQNNVVRRWKKSEFEAAFGNFVALPYFASFDPKDLEKSKSLMSHNIELMSITFGVRELVEIYDLILNYNAVDGDVANIFDAIKRGVAQNFPALFKRQEGVERKKTDCNLTVFKKEILEKLHQCSDIVETANLALSLYYKARGNKERQLDFLLQSCQLEGGEAAFELFSNYDSYLKLAAARGQTLPERLQYLYSACNCGEKNAQLKFAEILFVGDKEMKIEANRVRALYFLDLAASNYSARAQYLMAQEESKNGDAALYKEYLNLAAQGGDKDAIAEFEINFLQQEDSVKRLASIDPISKASPTDFQFIETFAKTSDVAKLKLALCYRGGFGCKRNDRKAEKILKTLPKQLVLAFEAGAKKAVAVGDKAEVVKEVLVQDLPREETVGQVFEKLILAIKQDGFGEESQSKIKEIIDGEGDYISQYRADKIKDLRPILKNLEAQYCYKFSQYLRQETFAEEALYYLRIAADKELASAQRQMVDVSKKDDEKLKYLLALAKNPQNLRENDFAEIFRITKNAKIDEREFLAIFALIKDAEDKISREDKISFAQKASSHIDAIGAQARGKKGKAADDAARKMAPLKKELQELKEKIAREEKEKRDLKERMEREEKGLQEAKEREGQEKLQTEKLREAYQLQDPRPLQKTVESIKSFLAQNLFAKSEDQKTVKKIIFKGSALYLNYLQVPEDKGAKPNDIDLEIISDGLLGGEDNETIKQKICRLFSIEEDDLKGDVKVWRGPARLAQKQIETFEFVIKKEVANTAFDLNIVIRDAKFLSPENEDWVASFDGLRMNLYEEEALALKDQSQISLCKDLQEKYKNSQENGIKKCTTEILANRDGNFNIKKLREYERRFGVDLNIIIKAASSIDSAAVVANSATAAASAARLSPPPLEHAQGWLSTII